MTYKYYLDIKNICNQQQQEKLEQLFGEMFTTDAVMGQYGKSVSKRKSSSHEI